MTVIIPRDYHVREALEKKKIECISIDDALKQDIRELRIGILNIMPKAETYEFSILFPLGKSVLQIKPIWIKLKNHKYKSSNKAHLAETYTYFEDAISRKSLDGLIITGAPVEEMDFEDITYWKEIKEILAYARGNIASTLGICWGGLALAKMLGIKKVNFPKKLFGIYEGRILDPEHPIIGEMDDVFYCPQSRHAGLTDKDLLMEKEKGNINLLVHGKEAGYFIFESTDGRYIAHLGHPEYPTHRLVEEALRDKKKGRKDVEPPVNFNIENPINIWRSHRNEFFTQWIKYVYEHTSY